MGNEVIHVDNQEHAGHLTILNGDDKCYVVLMVKSSLYYPGLVSIIKTLLILGIIVRRDSIGQYQLVENLTPGCHQVV